RVCGVQFRPGGFRPFAPLRPVSDWTGQRVPVADVLPGADPETIRGILGPETPETPGTPRTKGTKGTSKVEEASEAAAEDARVAALDAFLLGLEPEADPQSLRAMRLVDLVRTDRTILRVAELAAAEGVSVRSLQRLFASYVGVGPKWVILRYRIHEALERAELAGGLDWAELAAELGYSDQAHLVRDFTATVGVPPTAYARPAP
ncbi:helix-turn-helix domain-containing protein, partial [Streptomyces lunaelactis]|uniref:helix-turn-helix domain-containing protein n=2 Tax=Streptomyces lunaelactis TaxID=1535768 RepID=UPI001584C126